MVLFYFLLLAIKEASVDTVSGGVKTSFYCIREMQSGLALKNLAVQEKMQTEFCRL